MTVLLCVTYVNSPSRTIIVIDICLTVNFREAAVCVMKLYRVVFLSYYEIQSTAFSCRETSEYR